MCILHFQFLSIMKYYLRFGLLALSVTLLAGPTEAKQKPVKEKKSQSKKKKYIDPANMDLSVKPGENFYLYANGNWLKNNPVPPSKTRWGSFDMLRQTSLERLRALCEEAAANPSKDSIAQRVGDLYASAM